MVFRQPLSLTDLVSVILLILAECLVLSRSIRCFNCVKKDVQSKLVSKISFNLYYFPKILTKRKSQHILLQGTTSNPQISSSFILPLGSYVHKQFYFENNRAHTLHTLEREKVTDDPYLPKEHFPGLEPCHQQNLMRFDYTAHFWLNFPKGYVFPSLGLPQSRRRLPCKPLGHHRHLGNAKICLYLIPFSLILLLLIHDKSNTAK